MSKKTVMCSSENIDYGLESVMVKIQELHGFLNHPFQVQRDQNLFELRQSIEEQGILTPLIVRKNPYGDGYEIIAGHRRKEAALWLGLKEVPVTIREYDDDTATEVMVDSNIHREKIDLPLLSLNH